MKLNRAIKETICSFSYVDHQMEMYHNLYVIIAPTSNFENVCLLGDFTMQNIAWSNYSSESGNSFCNNYDNRELPLSDE